MTFRKQIVISQDIPSEAHTLTRTCSRNFLYISTFRSRNGMKSSTFTFLVCIDGLLLAMPVVNACTEADIQHLAKLLGSKRRERLECDSEVSTDLEADIQNRRSTRHIRLRHLPRLSIRDILVSETGDGHRILQRFAEMISLNVLRQ